MRQSLRGAANPAIQNDPITKQANAAVNMYHSFATDDLKKKESVPERYNRRIWEHNAFSTVNKDKGLTNKEINEIITYRTLTDPQYGYERINEIHEDLAKQEANTIAQKSCQLRRFRPVNTVRLRKEEGDYHDQTRGDILQRTHA